LARGARGGRDGDAVDGGARKREIAKGVVAAAVPIAPAGARAVHTRELVLQVPSPGPSPGPGKEASRGSLKGGRHGAGDRDDGDGSVVHGPSDGSTVMTDTLPPTQFLPTHAPTAPPGPARPASGGRPAADPLGTLVISPLRKRAVVRLS